MQGVLDRLAHLVSFDTTNPPRAHTLASPVFDWLRSQLAGMRLQEWDHGDGSVTLLAVRGEPGVVFNYHLDTVPAASGWRDDPFVLQVADDRATGLGACDIKGALAVMLDCASTQRGDLAVLITSDEEAGSSRCVREFLAGDHGFHTAIVAEPTECRAVSGHRGIVSARALFTGIAGHASEARAVADSAVHRAARWAVAAGERVAAWSGQSAAGLTGVRFNIGRLDGGVKPNMIAEQCECLFTLRTLPGQDGEALLAELRGLTPADTLAEWATRFLAPALPDAGDSTRKLADAAALAKRNALPTGAAVDFWSEAALFSAAGCSAIVFGSGNIAQAHTAQEWVALEQLETLHGHYTRLLTNGIQ